MHRRFEVIRKIFSLFIVLLVFIGSIFYPGTAGAEESINVMFTVGRNSYFINGIEHSMDVVPCLEEGKLYLPLRFAAAAVGIGEDKIVWDSRVKKVSLQKPGGTIEFQVGSPIFRDINSDIEMDAVPIIKEDRMLLPLRWVAEALRFNTTWNPVTLTACIGNDNAEFYYRQGYDYIDTEQYQTALISLQKAIDLDPTMAKAYNEMGYCYNMLGQFDQGITACSMAMGYNIALASAYSNRAYAYEQIGYMENAIRDYTRAIDYGLKRASEFNSRGSLFLETEQFNEALYDFNQAIMLEPDFAPSYFNRGIIYYYAGSKELAKADFEQALILDAGNDLYQAWLIQLKKEMD